MAVAADLLALTLLKTPGAPRADLAAGISLRFGVPRTRRSIASAWEHPCSREETVFPAGVDPRAKYWPVVRRLGQGYGDRNLVCSGPSIEELAEVF